MLKRVSHINKEGLKKTLIGFCSMFIMVTAFSQSQPCPLNLNFYTGDLTHWSAFTGTFLDQSGTRSIQTFDSLTAAPTGTLGTATILESGYGVNGIQVSNNNTLDPFGGFPVVPNINGYQYTNSVLLGSTTVSPGTNKGLIRGISYLINVPNGSVDSPYTITYAYAMVLENGSHVSNQQPLSRAILQTKDGIIACASPSYYLPTTGSGNALDVATAQKQGFSLSPVPSPNQIGNGNNPYRVWTKSWTEVTFNLSPYRGQQVTLTFEADNCIPGGHFSYAYFALRNACNGLQISGPAAACENGTVTYSVPSLADATYTWTIPNGWKKVLDSLNILQVVPSGANTGTISVHEVNSCADLTASLNVITTLPTIAGVLSGNNIVCSDNNSSKIILTGNRGTVVNWLSTVDGNNWVIDSVKDSFLVVQNLKQTTTYKALVQNGPACSIDSSTNVLIDVNPISKGGIINPSLLNICQGQNKGATLFVTGSVGNVLNWQSSTDSIVWKDFNPPNTDTFFNINNTNVPTKFRTIVKSGVCPSDTSKTSQVNIYNTLFPQAILTPQDVTICFGTKATLNASVSTGTSYTWLNSNSLYDPNSRNIAGTPYTISAQVAPASSTKYLLSVRNADCPNLLVDTFNVTVIPPIIVNAGHDTSVVENQPLQLTALVSDSTVNAYSWSPATGLNNSAISDPIATLGAGIDSINYKVTATNSTGCFGVDYILVRVYKSKPDILVPNAFTPNGDGKNDIIRPILLGISKLNYFRVYNRWGQLLFNTSEFNKGWDGNINGAAQQSGTYVYMTEGVDYLGNTIFRKGTIVLIR